MKTFLPLLSLSLLPIVTSYNFLVFCPLFGHSHTTFFAKIADVLTDAGHNVTFFTPQIVRKFNDIKYTRSTKNVIKLKASEKLVQIGASFDDSDFTKLWAEDFSSMELISMVKHFEEMFKEQSDVIQDNLELLDELKAQNFDVMIFEGMTPPSYPVLDYLEIKTHLPCTSMAYDYRLSQAIGEPVVPSYIPLPMSQSSDKMGFLERTLNSILPPIFDVFLPEPQFKSFRSPFDTLDISEIQAQAPFVFTNANPFIEFPKAIITKNIQIGGISVDVEKLKSAKVDEKWDEVLGKRQKTVLISFGSVMLSKNMPFIYKKSITKALSKFPDVTFIWKYEGNDTDEFAKDVENVHFSQWVPQTALLADPRLTAFVTHGGLGSVNEVSYLGKPTILCPLFADQMRNAKMLARHNGTIEISKFDLADQQRIEAVLRSILFDDSYRKNAEYLALQLEKQPVKPRELLLKYAEFAAQFGRLSSLDPYSRKMPFYKYFLLDVISIVIILMILIVVMVWKIGKFVWIITSKSYISLIEKNKKIN